MKSAYSEILRKMIKGGFRRKPDAWSFILTNEEIQRQCGTEDIEIFIRRLQRNYLTHLVRHDDSSLSKRLTFDENGRRPGRHITMESMVHQHEQMDTFNRRANERVFWNSINRSCLPLGLGNSVYSCKCTELKYNNNNKGD